MNYSVPPQQPGYAPQYPGYPQQPQAAPPAPAPAYPAPAPAYPQQGYAPAPQAYPPAPAQPPLATGSIDDFYNQPSTGGGPSLKFDQLNTRYVGVVARALGQGDVQQQTDTQGRPLFFRDGRPKWVMKVPLLINHPSFPDGTAQWYVKGATRDELNRAMAEAGSSAQAPEPGATIDVTFVSTRASGQGMNPAKVFRVVYTPPGVTPAQQAPVQPQPQAVAPQVPQAAPPLPQYSAPAPVQQQPQAPVQPQAVAPQAAPQAAPPAAMAPAPQPSALTPEQQQLLATLTGQQAPAQ